eukprot:746690-Pyramimonas_sp.AAC.1
MGRMRIAPLGLGRMRAASLRPSVELPMEPRSDVGAAAGIAAAPAAVADEDAGGGDDDADADDDYEK